MIAVINKAGKKLNLALVNMIPGYQNAGQVAQKGRFI